MMPHSKKRTKPEVSIPNYSLYEFAETMPAFVETERVSETDLYELECYNNYEIEAPLNHFSDSMLNDHLYTMYKKGKLKSPKLMQKLLCFFSKKYRSLIEQKVNEYLQSKKLTFDDWIAAVKNHRCGDIMCVYLLSMVMGNHTAIHLKNNKIWCTLKAVPLLHHELVEHCPIDLVYMGFGIFLQLKKRKTLESIRILGTISSDNPEVRTQLHLLVKTEKPDDDQSLLKGNITAAAGSKSQLQHVEQELNQGMSQEGYTLGITPKSEHHPKVKVMPFRVILKNSVMQQLRNTPNSRNVQPSRL